MNAVQIYIEGGAWVNAILRDGYDPRPCKDIDADAYIEGLDRFLSGGTNISGRRVFYRVVLDDFEYLNPGDFMLDEGFASYSMSKDGRDAFIAEAYDDVFEYTVIELHIPDGANIAGKAIKHPHGKFAEQDEFLMQRDTEFEIVSKQKVDGITHIITKPRGH